MNKKPPELPNIEDATLRACLAPLMDAMHAAPGAAVRPDEPSLGSLESTSGFSPVQPGSNDNPRPVMEPQVRHAPQIVRLTGDDGGTFRMIEQFLAMTDAELIDIVAGFPKQIGGSAARIADLKQRLADQYDEATTALALIERAMARVSSAPGSDWPPAGPSSPRDQSVID
jgi:hypothetical protein